jgi:hypothetical protein
VGLARLVLLLSGYAKKLAVPTKASCALPSLLVPLLTFEMFSLKVSLV